MEKKVITTNSLERLDYGLEMTIEAEPQLNANDQWEATRTLTALLISCNQLTLTVTHNGHQGGDAGHGGFVTFKLEGDGCTAMEVNGKECHEVELTFRGSTERDTFVGALQIAAKELVENQ